MQRRIAPPPTLAPTPPSPPAPPVFIARPSSPSRWPYSAQETSSEMLACWTGHSAASYSHRPPWVPAVDHNLKHVEVQSQCSVTQLNWNYSSSDEVTSSSCSPNLFCEHCGHTRRHALLCMLPAFKVCWMPSA